MDYDVVLKFWFEEISPAQWWKKDADFDQLIKQRFSGLYSHASVGELYAWRTEIRGRLAEIIILDQFSRNIFRHSAQAFATDSMAIALAQEAISSAEDKNLSTVERSFLYMPFMHSESTMMHEIARQLFDQVGIETNIESAQQHFDIIKRFSRYPHRNQLLWRESTDAEMEFLEQPGSSF
jgi:uncharacterized protein (DUF924 family)